MTLYWVSMIICDDDGNKPWLCSFTDGITNLSVAKDKIKIMRDQHNVISAWIDVFDKNNNKTTIFHECYIDVMGNIKKER